MSAFQCSPIASRFTPCDRDTKELQTPSHRQPESTVDIRNGFDFDQKVLFDEPVDDQQGVGWKDIALEQLGKQFGANLVKDLEMLGMSDVGRELDYVIEITAKAAQYIAQIAECLAQLGFEILAADDVAVSAHRQLPSDKHQFSVGCTHVRIEPLCLAGTLWIQILYGARSVCAHRSSSKAAVAPRKFYTK